MIIQLVKFKSALADDEALTLAKERVDAFREVPGLIQKHYLYDPESGSHGGLYIWESREALDAFRASDLAKSIPAAYKVIEGPRVEVFEHLFSLFPEAE